MNPTKRALARFTLLLMFVSLFAGLNVWAQGGTGDLTGLVTDQTKAIVPNAEVTLTNSATAEARKATTSSAGIYRFSNLPVVGSYTLAMSPQGFKKVEVKDIIVSVGTTITRDVSLQVGSANETVTVEAGAPLVQTSESQVSQLLDNRIWENMPLEFRSQNSFINLVAGAVPNEFSNLGNRGAAVNGTRSGTGNYMLDGFDNNEQGQGGRGENSGAGGANTSISPDAIQEYRVITNDYSAEYGKAGGFVTDTVLKSGTNAWHGSLYWFNRVQALAANDWFSNACGGDCTVSPRVQDKLIRNQEGGTIGGPIWKDKTFFYATYERHDLIQASPSNGVGFTQEFLNFVSSGAFEAFNETNPGGMCMVLSGAACPGALSDSGKLGPIFTHLQGVEPNAMPIAPVTSGACAGNTDCISQAIYPAAFGGTVNYPVHIYGKVTLGEPFTIQQNRASIKVDHRISDKDQLSAEYLINDSFESAASGGGDSSIFGTAFTNPERTQNAGVTWNHVFTTNLLNTAKIGYTRHRLDFPDNAQDQGVPSIFTFDSLSGAFGNSSALPQFFTENTFQFKDDMAFTKGKHNMKWGAEYRRTRNGSSFDALENGLFGLWSVEDLVTDATFTDQLDNLFFGAPTLGSFAEAEASVNPITGTLPIFYRGYRANELASYVQDSYRVLPRLTLNLGVRWEYFGPPHNFKPGIDSNFYFGQPVFPNSFVKPGNPFFPLTPLAAQENTGAFQVKNNDIWNKDLNNWAPRLGFAYDVRGDGKLVVRAGYGIAYDRMYNNIFENIRFNPPFFAFQLFGAGVGSAPGGALATPGLYTVPFTSAATAFFASLPGAKPSGRHMDQDLQTAYYQQGNLSVQWEFLKNYVLEANYIGTWGSHLLGLENINTYDGRLACSAANAPYGVGTPCGNAGFTSGFSTKRINTNLSSDGFRSSGFSSNYNALQLTVRHNFASGLQFSSSYTYSKALDTLSDAFNSRTSQADLTDYQNPLYDYGPADFNLKHRSVTSVYYELPWKKNNRWIGGWSVSGILSFQGGIPFSVYNGGSSYDPNGTGLTGGQRLDFIGTGSIGSVINNNISPAHGYFNTKAFAGIDNSLSSNATACPASVNMGLWCNGDTGRNALSGPGYQNVDFGIAKKFHLWERVDARIEANFFNLLNHPNFQNPVSDINNPSQFGSSTSDYGVRVTQLALRFDF